jgi:hypothetical protein
MGVLGLLAYVFMIVSVVFSARRTIAARDRWAPVALMGAAAAVSFLVVSTLFDVLAFPHATYIFLYTAGFTAVAISQGPRKEDAPPEPVIRDRVYDFEPPDGGAPAGEHREPALAGQT